MKSGGTQMVELECQPVNCYNVLNLLFAPPFEEKVTHITSGNCTKLSVVAFANRQLKATIVRLAYGRYRLFLSC